MELTTEELKWVEDQVHEICPIEEKEQYFCASKKWQRSELREKLRKWATDEVIRKRADMNRNIQGVNVKIDHPDLVAIKNVKELNKTQIFSSLSTEDQEKAYDELWKAMHPDTKGEKVEETKS